MRSEVERGASIHPAGIISNYFKMYNRNRNAAIMSFGQIFIDTPLKIIGDVYGTSGYGKYLTSRRLYSSSDIEFQQPPKLSWIKMINPLNIPLAIVKTTRAIINNLADKIPFTPLRVGIIAVLCTPLFIIDNFLDLFNKTPTQLYNRRKERRARQAVMKAGYENQSEIEFTRLEEHVEISIRVNQNATPVLKQAKHIDINLSPETKIKLAELAEECYLPNNREKLLSILAAIHKDPEYEKFILHYRVSGKPLQGLHLPFLKQPAKLNINLTNDQINALSHIHELSESLNSKKLVPAMADKRTEKILAKLRDENINQVLRKFNPEVFEPEKPSSDSISRG